MRSVVIKSVAIGLIVVGAVVFPLPIPLGLPMMAVGGALLFGQHPRFIGQLKRWRANSARVNTWLVAAAPRTPRFLREIIEASTPEESR